MGGYLENNSICYNLCMGFVEQYLGNFDLGNLVSLSGRISGVNLGPQVLFFTLGVIFILLWGLSLGRTRALVSLLSIYIAYVLITIFPYLAYVNDALNLNYDISFIRIGLFFAVYIIVFAILNGSVVKARLTMGESSLIIVGLISMLQLGLLISIIINNLSAVILRQAPEYILPFFYGQQVLFIWFLLPMVSLLFIKKD